MKKIECKECGGEEFITKPNSYDVYAVLDNKLIFQKSKIVDAKNKRLFCLSK